MTITCCNCFDTHFRHDLNFRSGRYYTIVNTPNRFVWFHNVFNFLGTNNDQGIRVYNDGILAGKDSELSGSPNILLHGPILLGFGSSGGGRNPDSSIQLDELLIYNRALTAAEIAILSQTAT